VRRSILNNGEDNDQHYQQSEHGKHYGESNHATSRPFLYLAIDVGEFLRRVSARKKISGAPQGFPKRNIVIHRLVAPSEVAERYSSAVIVVYLLK